MLVRTIALLNHQSLDESMVEVAERALSSLDEDPSRLAVGEVARVMASLLYGQHTPGPPASLDEAIAAVSKLPTAYRRVVFVHCAGQAMNEAARPDDAVRLLELARSPSGALDDDVDVQSMAVLAFARSLQARPAEALRAVEAVGPRVAELLAADPNQGNPVGAGLTFAYCFALVLDGRIDEAVAVAQLVHDETVRSGSPADQALAATLAARMHLFAGRPATARDLAEGALASCLEIGQDSGTALAGHRAGVGRDPDG